MYMILDAALADRVNWKVILIQDLHANLASRTAVSRIIPMRWRSMTIESIMMEQLKNSACAKNQKLRL